MAPLGPIRPHYWLTLGAANACGVDLARAMENGRLTHEDWADANTRCRACAEPEACARWLAAPEPEPDLPGYCRNGELFARIGSDPTD
ncbi:MAG TPA: DUF6455 family protein [Paracoccaceae bacterium]|nr:DUF6455 family protein [Paracoccaceae bacterium]